MEVNRRRWNVLMAMGVILLVLLLLLIFTKAFGALAPDEVENTFTNTEQENISANDDSNQAQPLVSPGDVGQPIEDDEPEEPWWDENELVEYTGPVEHLFFHPVVAYAELAFDGDYQANGIDDWMVTAEEYRKILESIYENDYVLVNMESLYTETEQSDGTTVMVKNKLMLPEGKKPLIISFDDVNYYDYMRENGFVYKLIIDENGDIASWGLDPEGNEVISRDLDVVTILDKFVDEHPDFSFRGAMASIGLTGYDCLLYTSRCV